MCCSVSKKNSWSALAFVDCNDKQERMATFRFAQDCDGWIHSARMKDRGIGSEGLMDGSSF